MSWCFPCGEAGLVVLSGERPPAAVDGIPELTDARSLAANVWRRVDALAYPDLRLSSGALVAVYGEPGAGKSTFATRFADSVKAPVLYASVEEPPGPTLAARFARLAVKREDFHVLGSSSVDQCVELAQRLHAAVLIIDSVQRASFTSRDLRHLLAVLPELRVLVGVAQVNAKGNVAGPHEFLHEADVVVRVDGLHWVVEKSRYQQTPTAPLPVLVGREAPHAASSVT